MTIDTRDAPDPEEQPPPSDVPVAEEVLAVPRHGLERREGQRKRVIVIGAGMAGLVAAFELARQGHDPLILEAQGLVGGRVYTLRSFAPGLYAEAGAMRIPRVHDLTLKYCNLFGLSLRPFMMGNPRGLAYIGGRRMTAEEARQRPDDLPFEVAEHERGRSIDDLWAEATRDLRELLEREGDAGWEQIVSQYDQYSLREFLVLKGFSEGAIEMYGVINFVESDMNNAVVEELREDLGRSFEEMQEIVGGTDMLPRAFYGELQDRIRFGAEVFAIDQDTDSVTVHFKTEAGRYSEPADTWSQDALRWGAMDEETRLEEALDDVSRIHPRIRDVYEVGASHAWYDDRYANGAFALFAPEQQTQLQADIVRPEGRIYFAGEHCSLYHAWIQGALESGIRAAQEIHEAS
jgi:monoamine oxidase